MILKSSEEPYVFETFSQFRSRLDVSQDEIVAALSEEEQALVLEEYEEAREADGNGNEDEWPIVNDVEDLPSWFTEGLMSRYDFHTNRLMEAILENRPTPYTLIFEDTVCRVIRVDDNRISVDNSGSA
jgi:hypothetical protein